MPFGATLFVTHTPSICKTALAWSVMRSLIQALLEFPAQIRADPIIDNTMQNLSIVINTQGGGFNDDDIDASGYHDCVPRDRHAGGGKRRASCKGESRKRLSVAEGMAPAEYAAQCCSHPVCA